MIKARRGYEPISAAHLIDGTPSTMANQAAYRALRGIPQTRQFGARRCPDSDHLAEEGAFEAWELFDSTGFKPWQADRAD
jgi:hypothetical protein